VDRLFWRLPIDDDHCISFVVDMLHLTGEAADAYRARRRQAQPSDPAALNALGDAALVGKLRLRDIDRSFSIYQLFWVEDYATQVGQGPVADRAHERLGKIDSGVILLRRLWQRELQALAEGQPLKEWTTPAGLADMTLTAPAGAKA
jgi:5,5'-dehydrodivanillate O-demethylase